MHIPNPRHHSLSAFWQNRPERRKVGDTLTATVEGAAAVQYQWYANGVAIPGADDETLFVDEAYVAQRISVTVTAEDGEEATSDATEPVTNDKSGEIKLVNKNGFQEDGTALQEDTLVIEYGETLGTPDTVIWYCDGAVKYAATINGAGLVGAFDSTLCVNPVTNVLDAGQWWATVKNTDGQTFVSQTVTVVQSGIAIMSAVSFEEDYESVDAAGETVVSLAETSDTTILNVTLNKFYTGDLYLVKENEKTFTTAKLTETIALDDVGGDGKYDGFTVVTKSSQFNNKAATTARAGSAVQYTDSQGRVHLKMVVDLANENDGKSVTRGGNYFLVFDQDGVTDDDLGTNATIDTVNASDVATVPYVEAPASIKVTSFANGTTAPAITMYNEDGDALEWWRMNASGDSITDGLDSIKMYGVDSNAIGTSDTATNPTDVTVDEGKLKLTTGGIAKKYAYAKIKTTRGVFAAKSVELVSEVAESARPALDSISVKEDSAVPENAVITLKGLSSKAPGTVYLLQGANDGDDFDDIAGYDVKDAIASTKVAGGASTATLEGVFKPSQITEAAVTANDSVNKFIAVFVPDDTELWSSLTSLTGNGTTDPYDGFTLKPTITSFDATDMAITVENTDAKEGEIAVSGIVVLDQFGNKWWNIDDKDTDITQADYVTKIDLVNVDATNTEVKPAAGVFTIDGEHGTLEWTASDLSYNNTGVDKGDGFKFQIEKFSYKATVTAKGLVGFAANDVTLDGTSLGDAAGDPMDGSDLFSVSH